MSNPNMITMLDIAQQARDRRADRRPPSNGTPIVPNGLPVLLIMPYAEDPTLWVQRSLALGRAVVALGGLPLCSLWPGALGLFGAPDESVPGVRDRALAYSHALARLVSSAGGPAWVVWRDDATLSPGSLLDLTAFHSAGGVAVQRTWAGWRSVVERA